MNLIMCSTVQQSLEQISDYPKSEFSRLLFGFALCALEGWQSWYSAVDLRSYFWCPHRQLSDHQARQHHSPFCLMSASKFLSKQLKTITTSTLAADSRPSECNANSQCEQVLKRLQTQRFTASIHISPPYFFVASPARAPEAHHPVDDGEKKYKMLFAPAVNAIQMFN